MTSGQSIKRQNAGLTTHATAINKFLLILKFRSTLSSATLLAKSAMCPSSLSFLLIINPGEDFYEDMVMVSSFVSCWQRSGNMSFMGTSDRAMNDISSELSKSSIISSMSSFAESCFSEDLLLM